MRRFYQFFRTDQYSIPRIIISEYKIGNGLRKFMSHIGQKSDRMTKNFLSTGEKSQGLAKEGEIKMSPFYVEGDRNGWQKRVT